jgi:NTE family protein
MGGTVREIGVVVSGAGARGAYEAGLLAEALPRVAERTVEEGLSPRFWFFGTSAGALNCALVASRAPRLSPGDPAAVVRGAWQRAMDEVAEVWAAITEPAVMDYVSPRRFLGTASRAYHLLFRLDRPHAPLAAAVDIDPLVRLANDPAIVVWDRLAERVRSGVVGAVGAATTARDGRTVVFLHRHDPSPPMRRDERRDIDYVDARLGPDHVLASSAIPSLFPAARITTPEPWRGWYYDGGVRLNTPLKPAISLGLRHLLIVGTHPVDRVRPTPFSDDGALPEADEALVPVVNQVMADQVIQDLYTLRRRNTHEGTSDEQVRYLYAGPPDDDTLAELAATPSGRSAVGWLRGALYGTARPELSSYLLFDPGYLAASLARGRRDAAALVPLPGTPLWQLQ